MTKPTRSKKSSKSYKKKVELAVKSAPKGNPKATAVGALFTRVAPKTPLPDPTRKSRERILATTSDFTDYYKAVSNHPNDNKAFPYAIEAGVVTGYRKYKKAKAIASSVYGELQARGSAARKKLPGKKGK